MKLGSETGSLVNHIMAGPTAKVPEVGMSATFLSWSDRYPGTIREVFTKGPWTYIGVSGDAYTRIDNNGMSESQSYEYDTTDRGDRTYFRRKEGQGWQPVKKNADTGRWVKKDAAMGGIAIGYRERYYDFSF